MINRQFKATPREQLKELKRGTVEVLPEDELLKKLENSYQTHSPLIVKFGADPSRPDIHIGHTVVINKLKLLQEFGHEVHFLIGDFTAQIGDPTGRKKARQQLSREEVNQNAKTYQDQIFKILDPEKTKIVYNSQWLNQLKLDNFLEILMTTTLVQLLSREDFSERFTSEQPIFLHEFMYPLLQGWDSVVLKADIELGGTDQKFNLLMGRHLQKFYQQPQQVLIILPLLEGIDGVNKMSKSWDNTISLTEMPKDMFGKIMSISDQLMLRYYELLSSLPNDEIEKIKLNLKNGKLHPMEAKKNLAQEIVNRFHGNNVGLQERERFDELFTKKTLQTNLPEVQVHLGEDCKLALVAFMVEHSFAKSNSEARRLLKQKALRLDGQILVDEWIPLEKNKSYIFRSGKLHTIKLITH